MKDGKRDRKPEAARADAAGVQIQHAVLLVDMLLVRMSANDHTDACGLRLDVKVEEIVQHVDGRAADFDKVRSGELRAGSFGVDVAFDRGHGSDDGKAAENVDVAHVSCMQDVVHTLQHADDLRTQESVRIRNDTYPECATAVHVSSVTQIMDLWAMTM